jgi:predicted nucleic acid-binding Zn ribbon protein
LAKRHFGGKIITMTTNDHSRRTKSQILWYGAGILVILLLLAIALPRL